MGRAYTLKEMRKLHKMTLREMGEVLGKSLDYYRNRERYLVECSGSDIQTLLTFYGCDFNEIIWKKQGYDLVQQEKQLEKGEM